MTTDDGKTVSTPVSPKVYGATGGGAAVLLLGYLLAALGLDVPEPVVGALAVLVTFAAGYLTPDRLRVLGELTRRGRGEHRA